jgi:hypothetical protein
MFALCDSSCKIIFLRVVQEKKFFFVSLCSLKKTREKREMTDEQNNIYINDAS